MRMKQLSQMMTSAPSSFCHPLADRAVVALPHPGGDDKLEVGLVLEFSSSRAELRPSNETGAREK